MTQRHTDTGNPGSGSDRTRASGGGASRSNVYDEPPLEPPSRRSGRSDEPAPSERGPGGSRHWLHDTEPPRMDFSGEAPRSGEEAPQWGWETNTSDFEDYTSRSRHSGYGDYGTPDYAPRREFHERGATRPRDFRDYGRGDYRGNVGPGGFGYSESNYGPTRYNERNRGEYGQSGREPTGDVGGGGMQREYGQFGQRGERRLSHRGRGPRNYARSDERIREIICERLTDDPYVDASDVSIEVKNGEVTLTGTVGSRSAKFRIEDIAEESAPGKEIHNQVRVKRSEGGEGRWASYR